MADNQRCTRNGAKMAGRSATLDEQGNPTAIDEWHDSQTTFHNTYTYDDFNRLTSWSLEGQQQDAWTYDRVGNWTMNGWTADPKADMLTASPGSKTYTYNPRGGLKEVYDNSQQDQTFGYDPEGLLTLKTDMQQQLLSLMGWEHAGRRIELTASGGGVWRFIYDPTASVPAVLVEDLNGSPQAFYVREPDGRLIARDSGDGLQYYFFDLLGSTILMAPATENNPTDRFYYTPWGQTVTTGSRASTVGTAANPYRFVGSLGYYHHHQDPNLADWMQLGVRFYQPELGRFERRDPIDAPGHSAFTYGRGMPLAASDPSGAEVRLCRREIGHGANSSCVQRVVGRLLTQIGGILLFPVSDCCHWYLDVSGTALGWRRSSPYQGLESPADAQCQPIPASKKQEKCLRENFAAAARGRYALCKQYWTGPQQKCPKIELLTRCQDFVNCLLGKCGLPRFGYF